jgi:hypothetical protein
MLNPSAPTAYLYLHEGIDVLAAMAPMHGPRWAAHAGRAHPRAAGRQLIRTDRSEALGLTAGVNCNG